MKETVPIRSNHRGDSIEECVLWSERILLHRQGWFKMVGQLLTTVKFE